MVAHSLIRACLLGLALVAAAIAVPAAAQSPSPTASASPAGTPSPTAPAPTRTPVPPTPTRPAAAIAPYVSLGDSLADAQGASSRDKGYVARFAAQVWTILKFPGSPDDRIDFGVRGETTSSILAPGAQLDKAVAEIGRRNGDSDRANDVVLITITIGGNDALTLTRATSPCATGPTAPGCPEAITAMVATFGQNLPVILGKLRAAAPKATILVGSFYNPFSGTGITFDAPGDQIAEQVTAITRQVASNRAIDAIPVDLAVLFQGKAPLLTHIAEFPPDIHPTDTGYGLIADAFAAALRARVSPPAPPASGGGFERERGPALLGEDGKVAWLTVGLLAMAVGGALAVRRR